jgi:hypothetical protein
MVLRKFMGIFAITLFVGAASLAMAGVPDVNNCTATRTDDVHGKAVLFVVPGLSAGSTFDTAIEWANYPLDPPSGVHVEIDATIEVIVKDGATPPVVIANYPFEDIWVVNPDIDGLGPETGLFACDGGNTADASTDVLGYTEFRNPMSAGGFSTGLSTVVINGNAVPGGVDVSYNSSDNDGNGTLNGIDLQAFTNDFFDFQPPPVGTSTYEFKSDLYLDGLIDGTDLATFAANFFGKGC